MALGARAGYDLRHSHVLPSRCPVMESVAGGFVILGLMPIVLGGLAVAYLALRVRDARAEPADPQLGLKAACYSFMTAGILLALSGVSLGVIDLLGDAMDGKRPQ